MKAVTREQIRQLDQGAIAAGKVFDFQNHVDYKKSHEAPAQTNSTTIFLFGLGLTVLPGERISSGSNLSVSSAPARQAARSRRLLTPMAGCPRNFRRVICIGSARFSKKILPGSRRHQRYGENNRAAASRNRAGRGRASISTSETSRAEEILFAITFP